MERMRWDGTLGDFFPHTLCPFLFEDTLAALIGAEPTEGYLRAWNNSEVIDEKKKNALPVSEMQRFIHSGHTDRLIIDEVFRDKNGQYFTLQTMELDFLDRHGLPLPTENWLTRIRNNF
jgi:hypothetical protein